MLFLDFSLKNEHNIRITDVFKKNDKLSVLLNYTSMEIPKLLKYKTQEKEKQTNKQKKILGALRKVSKRFHVPYFKPSCKLNVRSLNKNFGVTSPPVFTSSKLTIETLEQGVKYVNILLLTLNIFHTLFQCFYC